jgi:hypothetical protein
MYPKSRFFAANPVCGGIFVANAQRDVALWAIPRLEVERDAGRRV